MKLPFASMSSTGFVEVNPWHGIKLNKIGQRRAFDSAFVGVSSFSPPHSLVRRLSSLAARIPVCGKVNRAHPHDDRERTSEQTHFSQLYDAAAVAAAAQTDFLLVSKVN